MDVDASAEQLLGLAADNTTFLGVALAVQVACVLFAAWAVMHQAGKRRAGGNEAGVGKAAGTPTPEQLAALIQSRRSVFAKDFTGEAVDRRKLERMLEAANWAPSHKVTYPWRFVVLGGSAKDAFEDLTIQLAGQLLQGDKRQAALAKYQRKKAGDWARVGCYIPIILTPHPDKLPEWEELAAVSAAVQNLWLMAASEGVAGYWSSWAAVARDAPEMAEFLGMASGERCLGCFVAGVPGAGAAGYRASRPPWEQKVEWRL